MSSIMCTNGWGGEELEVKGGRRNKYLSTTSVDIQQLLWRLLRWVEIDMSPWYESRVDGDCQTFSRCQGCKWPWCVCVQVGSLYTIYNTFVRTYVYDIVGIFKSTFPRLVVISSNWKSRQQHCLVAAILETWLVTLSGGSHIGNMTRNIVWCEPYWRHD